MNISLPSPSIIWKKLRIPFFIFLGWFVLHSGFTVMDGVVDDAPHGRFYPAHVAVVYGNKVNEDGTLSRRLKARCDKAVDLVDMYAVEFVIVSGGLGKEGHEEAEVMRDYLIEQGVDPNTIIVDNEGYNTYQTSRNAARIMKERGWYKAYVVSNYYHITRARLSLRSYEHVQDVYGGKAKMGFELRDLWSIPREFLGYYVYLFRNYKLEG